MRIFFMAKYLLSIDQGTTGSTVLIIDVTDKTKPAVLAKSTVDFEQHYPNTGWVEHDLNQIWDSVKNAATKSIEIAKEKSSDFDLESIISLGITNQRETVCVYDKSTLEPIHNAIVWQCRRTTDYCNELKSKNLEQVVREKTGLVLDPYFSGTKLAWMVNNKPEVKSKLDSGDAIVGTIDTFLISKLTSGKVHATEASNASRTLLYNINTGEWDDQLLEAIGFPYKNALAELKDSSSNFGKTEGVGFLPDGISINGVLGDQQAAMVGQTCFGKGEAKCTYGTGAFLLVNIGEKPVHSDHGLLTTVAWQLDGKRIYALEGASFIAGAGVQFIRDQLNFLDDAKDSEKLSENSVASPEVYFVPALAGLGSPHWLPEARGAFLGLTRGTTKNSLIRATLEGITFSVGELVGAMESDFGEKISVMRVDGGASANNLLMQFQSDICQLPLDRPKNLETTAFGAAMFAGLGCGLYSSLEDIKVARESDKIFNANMDDSQRDTHLTGWGRAVGAVKYFATNK
jgi:glycerol kinase